MVPNQIIKISGMKLGFSSNQELPELVSELKKIMSFIDFHYTSSSNRCKQNLELISTIFTANKNLFTQETNPLH